MRQGHFKDQPGASAFPPSTPGEYIELTDGPYKGIHLGLKDDGQKIPLSLFMTVNWEVLNEFQRTVIPMVMSVDFTKKNIGEAMAALSYQVQALEVSGWRPKAVDGDVVNLPHHYKRFPIEPTLYNQENRVDWLRANFMKYVCRYTDKNGVEDLRKALRNLAMFSRWALGEEAWNK